MYVAFKSLDGSKDAECTVFYSRPKFLKEHTNVLDVSYKKVILYSNFFFLKISVCSKVIGGFALALGEHPREEFEEGLKDRIIHEPVQPSEMSESNQIKERDNISELDVDIAGDKDEPSGEDQTMSKERNSRPKRARLSTAKDAVMPGGWGKGGVPSTTLTSIKFSKINKHKISAQKYPCCITKSSKTVNMQRKDCEQLIPVKKIAQFEENKENVEWTEEDKTTSETKWFDNESVNDLSEGVHVKDVAKESDIQQCSGAVQVSKIFNNI